MEDSFRARVDKIFGSLSSPSSSSAVVSSSNNVWSLSDEKVEHIKWNREKNIADSTSVLNSESDFLSVNQVDAHERSPQIRLKELEDDIEELDDCDSVVDDYGHFHTSIPDSRPRNNSLFDQEEWEIRSSIGLDSTLDNEEEEDEYDKVAAGTESSRDGLYLKDDIDDSTIVDTTSSSFIPLPDPSASVRPRPILKRKECQRTDTKSIKRVRFDPNCRTVSNSDPDYIRNPSKYTCYSLDDGEEDEVCNNSNQKAYADFLEVVKNSPNFVENAETETVQHPSSLSFIPRKRTSDDCDGNVRKEDISSSSNSNNRNSITVARALVAMDEEESQVCAMDEDGGGHQSLNGNGVTQPGRQYRTKTRYDSL